MSSLDVNVKRFTDAILVSGGPPINASEIAWATDIPSGKALVDWFAAQLLDDHGLVVGGNNEHEILKQRRSALKNIALEKDEVAILRHINPSSEQSEDSGTEGALIIPSAYASPSYTRKRADCILTENGLLNSEMQRLKSHLRQTKIASEKLSETVKSLRSIISKTNREVDYTQERLSDMSLSADTTISTTLSTNYKFIDDINTHLNHQVARSDPELTSLTACRSLISSQCRDALHRVHNAQASLPDSSMLRADGNFLRSEIDKLDLADIKETVFMKELGEVIKMVETAENTSVILAQVESQWEEREVEVDVLHELERAWAQDQAELLDMTTSLVETTLHPLETCVLDSLVSLHTSLKSTDNLACEVEAYFGAQGEEMEEIIEDVARVRGFTVNGDEEEKTLKRNDALTIEIERTLKELKDLRPVSAPPLVLLESKDILDEVNGIMKRKEVAEKSEEIWVEKLRMQLEELNSVHAIMESLAYSNSPLNTSPPFLPPENITKLENDAEYKVKKLEDLVQTLQADVDAMAGSTRMKKKKKLFADKWITTN